MSSVYDSNKGNRTNKQPILVEKTDSPSLFIHVLQLLLVLKFYTIGRYYNFHPWVKFCTLIVFHSIDTYVDNKNLLTRVIL